ncbi:hypothetical protein SCO02_13170 [Staphylococcus ureilyticus]|uniref:Uncharacterized protein n=1 Tax=Staphylococcus ureilyticus TaxID=94138 RepID=A0AB34AIA5_STAUR|nr:hypothetical protein SCO02_13170 [Staphylococcus ureilyticus]
MIPLMIAPGMITKPERNADNSNAFCTYNGINKAGPIIDIITIMDVIVVNVNTLFLNTIKFSKGLGTCNCLLINT